MIRTKWPKPEFDLIMGWIRKSKNDQIEYWYKGGKVTEEESWGAFRGPGTYFLMEEGEIVYIGASSKIRQRIKQHTDKLFNEVGIICNELDGFCWEPTMIRRFHPLFNIQIPKKKGSYIWCHKLRRDTKYDVRRRK